MNCTRVGCRSVDPIAFLVFDDLNGHQENVTERKSMKIKENYSFIALQL